MADCYSEKRFLTQNVQKAFGDRALPGPAGRAYSASPGCLAGFKGREGTRRDKRGEEKGGIIPNHQFLDATRPVFESLSRDCVISASARRSESTGVNMLLKGKER